MKRLAAIFLAAVVVSVVALPAFAGTNEMGEFSPGDAPPAASAAAGGQATAASHAASDIGALGTPDGGTSVGSADGASAGRINKAYSTGDGGTNPGNK